MNPVPNNILPRMGVIPHPLSSRMRGPIPSATLPRRGVPCGRPPLRHSHGGENPPTPPPRWDERPPPPVVLASKSCPREDGGREPIPLPAPKCLSERSAAPPTCHSERSAAESKNLVAIAPSPSHLPPVGAVREPPVPQPLITPTPSAHNG